ncbi:MAG: CsgG/HfaB family protein, partial [Chthoniobacterales bacterium]
MRFLIVCTVAFLAVNSYCKAEKSERLHVAVFSPTADRNLEDLCIAALSKNPEIEVVERKDLHSLLNEQTLTSLNTPAGIARLGHLLSADIILSVRKSDNTYHLQTIDCATGKILGHESANSENLPRLCSNLVTSSYSAKKVNPAGKVIRLAVEDFKGENLHAALKTSAEIRDALGAVGFEVVERSVIEHAAAEHELQRTLFAKGEMADLLGANYLVQGSIEKDELHLKILNSDQGKVEALATFPLKTAKEESAEWLRKLLKPSKTASVNLLDPHVQIESLVPFYEGVKYYRDGDVRNALLSFWWAERLDDKFLEAREWEARCYDALGFAKIAAATRRYCQVGLVGRGISPQTRNVPVEAIAFLGVQTEIKNTPLQMKAIDALLRVSPFKIILSNELTPFRDEYDALVGGSPDAWLRAPVLLARWSLRASLSKPDQLQWTLFDTGTGRIVATRETPLEEPKMWDASLKELVDTISAVDSKQEAKATLTFPPQDRSTLVRELSSPDADKANLAILQLLYMDPKSRDLWGVSCRREDGYRECFNFALRDQIIASLPERDAYRAWLELWRIATFYPFPNVGRVMDDPDPLTMTREFIKNHPDDAQGAFARYMLLWITMKDMKPQELAAECADMQKEFQAHAAEYTDMHDGYYIPQMTKHLEILARIANGENVDISYLPKGPYPKFVYPALRNDGKVFVHCSSEWQCNEWEHVRIEKSDWKKEAVAALKILSSGNGRRRVPSEWLKDSPHSI